jgi:competence protein ComEA
VRRRREPGADGAATAERLTGLLLPGPGRATGGWVPDVLPPGPECESGPEPEREPQPEPGPPAALPQQLEVSWAPRASHGAPVEDGPADEPEPEPPPDRPHLLPDTLRGGRLDPGRTGAVALLLVCVLAAVVAAGVVLRGRPQEVAAPSVEQVGEPLPGVTDAPAVEPDELVVSVGGDVVAPGLVRLPPGSRVDDAVRAAGGLAPGASYGLLNLARKLVDGEQVLVGVDPPPGAAAVGGGGAAAGGLVSLNAATAADLESLPGIGPVLAERIVDWRTEHGPFRSVDQLREVPGIGESKYAALKSKVTV